MTFDRQAFRNAKWDDRTERVPAPSLATFFAQGDEPVVVVRGLTKEQINRAQDITAKAPVAQALLAKLAAEDGAGTADAILAYLGIPADESTTSTRVEYQLLKAGIVEPAMELEDIRRWANAAPDEVAKASAAIDRCTKMGKVLAGSPNSG